MNHPPHPSAPGEIEPTAPHHRRRLVAAAVIVHHRCVLLVRRTRTEPGLHWALPAGKPEPGETAQDAAVRETWEETGLKVTAGRVLGDRVHPGTGWHIHYVACTPEPGTGLIRPDTFEIQEAAWVPYGELHHYVPQGFDPRVQAFIDTACGTSP
ncbi:NUDIX hydrolase [Streptomyces tsukubensis]|uniref:NUDIX hydrolase n=1 Tax=Streptomyces tsukubensis TaxID=83656 RepID=UPI00344C656C